MCNLLKTISRVQTARSRIIVYVITRLVIQITSNPQNMVDEIVKLMSFLA